MAVGMMGIGRLVGHLEANQGQYGAGGVGQVIQRVSGDGNRPGQGSRQQLQKKQQQVAHNTDSAGQAAHRCAHPGRITVPVIFYENAK